jgi:sec-independent protein translocase protein TatB
MFDISFSEMAILGVVALIVIGPERLPKVARTAGHLFGRFQRYVAGVRSDIQREIDASELSKVKQEVDAAARVFEDSVREHSQKFDAEVRALEKSSAPDSTSTNEVPTLTPADDSATTGASQAALLAEQEAGLEPGVNASNAIGPSPKVASAAPPQSFAQGAFDFGIEPLRSRKP